MKNEEMKLLSVQIPVSLYRALRNWAYDQDSDVSKTVRKALREFCEVRGIPINREIDLAEKLAKAGIGLEELG